MAVLPVLRVPDPRLNRVSGPVGTIGDQALRLAGELVDTMRAHPHCVGLAAPQIGVPLRAFCVDVSGHPKARSCSGLLVLFDPELVTSGPAEIAREGCMSVPDLTGTVARAGAVVVHGRRPDGSLAVIEADAFEARALQHELDHLDGTLFLDRVASRHADLFARRRYR